VRASSLQSGQSACQRPEAHVKPFAHFRLFACAARRRRLRVVAWRAPCLASPSPRAGAPCELLLGEARSSRLADGATKQMRGGSSKPALPASRGVVGMETMLSGMA
jgi:hypothetical protein